MAQVTVLDAIVNRSTEQSFPALSAGTNRAAFAVFAMYNGGGTARVPATVTCNGRTAQWVGGDAISATQTRLAMALYMFLETDISAISGQAIATTGQAGTVKSLATFTIQNYPQSTNPQNIAAYTTTGATTSTLPLARGPESLTVAFSYVNTASSPTTMVDPTRDATIAFANGTLSYATEPDTERSANHTATGGTYRSSLAINFNSIQRAVVNVNSGAGVTPGSAGNTVLLTGFTQRPLTMVLGSKSATNIGGTNTNATFDFPDYVDLQTYPDPTGTHSFVATYNSETANLNVPLNLKPGIASVTLLNPNNSNVNYFGYHADVPPVSTDKLLFPSSVVTFYEDTDWDAPGAASNVEVWHWVNATDTMYQYFVTFNNAGQIVSVTKMAIITDQVIDMVPISMVTMSITAL